MSGLATTVEVLATFGGVGAGLTMLGSELAPSRAALGPALSRLHRPVLVDAAAAPPDGLPDRIGVVLARRYGQSRFIPRTKLRLLDRSVEGFLAQKVTIPLLGLLFPLLLSALLLIAGVSLPWSIPAGVGLLFATILFFAVDLDVTAKAEEAHAQARYFLAAFLDLVALNAAASRGPVDSLHRASATNDNWLFIRIRTRLQVAQLDAVAPWTALRDLADEIGVRQLGEIGEIMQMAGESGGLIHDTVRAKARGIRAEILAEEEDAANKATTKLYIATPLYVFVLFAALIYPYIARAIF